MIRYGVTHVGVMRSWRDSLYAERRAKVRRGVRDETAEPRDSNHIWLRQSVTFTVNGQTRTVEMALPLRAGATPGEVEALLDEADAGMRRLSRRLDAHLAELNTSSTTAPISAAQPGQEARQSPPRLERPTSQRHHVPPPAPHVPPSARQSAPTRARLSSGPPPRHPRPLGLISPSRSSSPRRPRLASTPARRWINSAFTR